MVTHASFLEAYERNQMWNLFSRSDTHFHSDDNEHLVVGDSSEDYGKINLSEAEFLAILIECQVAGFLRERGDCLDVSKDLPEGKPLTKSKEDIQLS